MCAMVEQRRRVLTVGVIQAPVDTLAWSPHGHQLLLCEATAPRQLTELSFAKALAQGHRIQHSMQGWREEEEPVHVLQVGGL